MRAAWLENLQQQTFVPHIREISSGSIGGRPLFGATFSEADRQLS
jgi:hypothetical protein